AAEDTAPGEVAGVERAAVGVRGQPGDVREGYAPRAAGPGLALGHGPVEAGARTGEDDTVVTRQYGQAVRVGPHAARHRGPGLPAVAAAEEGHPRRRHPHARPERGTCQ